MMENNRLTTILIVVIVALLGVSGYLFWQLSMAKNPEKTAEREVKALVEEVGVAPVQGVAGGGFEGSFAHAKSLLCGGAAIK